MNEDFSELIQYLDGKFRRIDERFDEMKKDFVNLQTSVDTYAKKADTYFQEMVILAHKVDRHEKWIKQIAEKLGIKLEYQILENKNINRSKEPIFYYLY
ncbi:MAG: hypothetical protein ABIK66_05450 [candidate division WOR-3 bacterium]